MDNNAKIFEEIVQGRKSYRVFDKETPISDEVIKRSIERAILSPNSSNMQLWEFYIVKKQKDIDTIAKICLNQTGAKTASQLVVFVARPDKWKSRQKAIVKNLDKVFKDRNSTNAKKAYYYYEKLMPMVYENSFALVRDLGKKFIIWNKARKKAFVRDVLSKDIQIVAHKSIALAAQTFMLSITAEGFDSLPMEGFDAVRLKKFLMLPKTASVNMVVAVGKGKPEGIYGPRFRIPFEEVVFEI